MSHHRILVTGGAGFVGSHLVRRLLAEGHELVVLDNLLTGSEENVAEFVGHPRFRFVQHDVISPYDVPCDRLYNLACAASPPQYQRDPIHTLLTSVQGVYNGLCNAHRYGARFLQASTSEIYGDPDVSPQAESYRGNVSTTGPRACYDEGKRCAESLIMDFHRARGLEVRIARIFNTYGPGMTIEDGRVVSNFLTQALLGEPLTVYGDGQQTRSFCYVDDLVDGLIGLMEQPHETGPMNLGNPVELTVLEIAERVLALCGGGRISRMPLPTDDPKQRRPDISLAQRCFGFEPRVGLDQGLRATKAYFEQRLEERRLRSSAAE